MTNLSFQLYSARNYQPWSDIFAKLAAAGYKEVEGIGAIYEGMSDSEIADLKAELDRNGLSMPTGHLSLDILENRPARAIEIAKAFGMESTYCPWVMPELRPTSAEGWYKFGQRIQKAGQPLIDAGFDYGWHNHDFEFVTFDDGVTAQEHFFRGGPDLSWECDVAWIVRGKADPMEWIEKMGDRITSVHVKDIAAPGENADEDGWADVGHGVVPWAKIKAALKNTKARHFIIEHDNPNDIDRFITRSFQSYTSF